MEFAPTVVAKLREMAELHRDLSRQLADPEVASDHRRYTELLREQGQLEEANRLPTSTGSTQGATSSWPRPSRP